MSHNAIALLMFSSMMVLLLTGKRVFGAIGFGERHVQLGTLRVRRRRRPRVAAHPAVLVLPRGTATRLGYSFGDSFDGIHPTRLPEGVRFEEC